jgi:hypothetical protein
MTDIVFQLDLCGVCGGICLPSTACKPAIFCPESNPAIIRIRYTAEYGSSGGTVSRTLRGACQPLPVARGPVSCSTGGCYDAPTVGCIRARTEVYRVDTTSASATAGQALIFGPGQLVVDSADRNDPSLWSVAIVSYSRPDRILRAGMASALASGGRLVGSKAAQDNMKTFLAGQGVGNGQVDVVATTTPAFEDNSNITSRSNRSTFTARTTSAARNQPASTTTPAPNSGGAMGAAAAAAAAGGLVVFGTATQLEALLVYCAVSSIFT